MKVRTFKDLLVWQKAFDLCLAIYKATAEYPRAELYGLVAETRKTSRQIIYSIAEGQKRRTTADFLRFLNYSQASGTELETQLLLGGALGYLTEKQAEEPESDLTEVKKMLHGLVLSLQRRRVQE